MTEEDVRKIIRDEFKNIMLTDRFVFNKHIQVFDARNIQLGRTTGTMIGTATDQRVAFYGITPVDQPATVTDAVTQGAGYVQEDVNKIVTAVNAIIDRLQELGLIA